MVEKFLEKDKLTDQQESIPQYGQIRYGDTWRMMKNSIKAPRNTLKNSLEWGKVLKMFFRKMIRKGSQSLNLRFILSAVCTVQLFVQVCFICVDLKNSSTNSIRFF